MFCSPTLTLEVRTGANWQSALTDEDLFGYGLRLELDTAAVAEGLDGRFDATIRANVLGGIRSGVNGTPSLFINGLRYDGERDVESLVAALRQTTRAVASPLPGARR
jgi:protein-disulfide isomerase